MSLKIRRFIRKRRRRAIKRAQDRANALASRLHSQPVVNNQ